MTGPQQKVPARWCGLLAVILFWTETAFAHVQRGEAAGFLSGLKHPVSGLDHVLAMVAVGLWGAQLGAPAVWVLPVAFPMVMAFGGMLGLMGVSIPGSEYGIAASAILLGVVVMCEIRPPYPSLDSRSQPSQSFTDTPMAPNCRWGKAAFSTAWGLSLQQDACTVSESALERFITGHGDKSFFVSPDRLWLWAECSLCGGRSSHEMDQAQITNSNLRYSPVRLRVVSAHGRGAFEFHRHGACL